jgi:hypothetical protein
MIKNEEIIDTFEVSSFIDFIVQFDLQEQALKDFNDIQDIQDVYNSKYFTDDETHIVHYLTEIKDKAFDIQFMENRHDNFWVITEFEPVKDKIKRIMVVLGKYPKVVNTDEIYFPYSSIESTLKEVL